MTKEPTLGERMKRYEQQTRQVLPKRTYTLIRVDGRAFHSYTRGLHRPFDESLVAAMDATAVALCRGVQGAEFAYVQSDEISVLATDFATHQTEPWMGGVLQKVVSLTASLATAEFATHRVAIGLAQFDSRAWTIADPNEVMNYFVWRQRDCVKNSITMTAQAFLGHKALDGLNSNERQELLFREKGVNWNDIDDGLKRGRLVRRIETEPQPGVVRNVWVPEAAPHFTGLGEGWLAKAIPAMPALPEPRPLEEY